MAVDTLQPQTPTEPEAGGAPASSTRHAIDTGPCGASIEALQKVIDSSGRGATITRR